MEEGSENQTVPSGYLNLLENNINLKIPENTTFGSAGKRKILVSLVK